LIQAGRDTPGTFGVVVIGRNEGERLKRCLGSVTDGARKVTYVDSGSTDDSVAFSRSLGVTVVELDMRKPFTAARARNEGFSKLLELEPTLDYVFFVDGDCEVVTGWLDKATRYLDEHQDFAVVWGIRRELFPEKSLYNRLCDIEWLDYPMDETTACGGDALIRVDAFRKANGFRPDLICAEEADMCVRIRQGGWRIMRLREPMTLHDAAILRFPQWWKRMQRTGYSFALSVQLHGAPPERQGIAQSRRAWAWGLILPLLTVGLTALFGPVGLLLLLIYPLQIVRLALSGNHSPGFNWLRATGLILGRFPEAHGQLQFMLDRLRRTNTRLIEYK
jgi:GT2 family glycosyltransferase